MTNDGATILRAVGVDNPAAKVLVEMSRVQDSEVGDGTTSVTVLASELIREAEKLVEMRIHPQTIIAGWRKASAAAKEALEKSATDHSKDETLFREDLMNIARTTLSSKILSQHKDFFSKLAVDAVLRLKGSGNLDAIQITKIQGGTLEESFLDEGKEIFLNLKHCTVQFIFLILSSEGKRLNVVPLSIFSPQNPKSLTIVLVVISVSLKD